MKSYKYSLMILAILLSIAGRAQDNSAPAGNMTVSTETGKETCDGSCCCSNSQSPVGVMTDHLHPKGSWMVSYTYMNMMMQGNRMAGKSVSNDAIYQNYVMAPDYMTMQMHMLMVMYGVTDNLTLMAMGGYSMDKMNMKMDQQGIDMMMNMPGMQSNSMAMMDHMTSTSKGISDTKLYALYGIKNTASQRLIACLGVSLPTGTTNAQGMTLTSLSGRLPYQMQIGTGSFSVLPSLTYVRVNDKFSWGGAAMADVKLNNNSLGYRFGNVYDGTAWAAYKLLPFMRASLRAEYVATGKIQGYDTETALLMNNDPSANTANYGGQNINGYIGLNFSSTRFKGFSLLAEYGRPVYQHMNGLQMAGTANVYATLQYSF